MEATPDRLMTAQDLARRLGVGQEKVRELAREGRIPVLYVGATMRFELEAVLAALREAPPRGAVPNRVHLSRGPAR
jgi:excisionase family DNA binding protein